MRRRCLWPPVFRWWGQGLHALIRYPHLLSTLALDGGSAVGTSRMASALRYVDLVILAAALPLFIAADLPMTAYAVVAGVWIAQHGVELLTARAVRRAAARGDRRAAMGWVG